MVTHLVPDKLFHYYDCSDAPFRSLTTLSPDEAEQIMATIRQQKRGFASQRQPDYLTIRRELEAEIRALFIEKGGKPDREHPHYMILGQCQWVKTWYEKGCEISVPLRSIASEQVSFTYSDSFPAMRYDDGKPYRGQVYTLTELPELIAAFGLPQQVNPDGELGPDRYIEAQIWSDDPVQAWL